MEDWDPKSHRTDALLILLHGIGADRGEAVAKISADWPAIEWGPLQSLPIFGSLKVGRFTIDLSLNLNGRDFPSLSLESNPQGNYFDIALVSQILATCERNGWTATFFDSANDVFL